MKRKGKKYEMKAREMEEKEKVRVREEFDCIKNGCEGARDDSEE